MVVSRTARYMTLHTPAGFDAFVREVSQATAADGTPPDRAALVALAAAHGIDITGPGLTLKDYDHYLRVIADHLIRYRRAARR